ncbi:hypothetical protein JM18_000346 [Phytophthora kernoviae]|uniref:ATP-dependent DNA helicase n=2 Tax=Phytophthora kernoviae TaxID=325452 RepID=A0A8T0M9W4_9STRA|nr:hypothetical protein G195_001371 [Phytophthora kernoviae 00238/432]KAG2531497.1 hypothetical protein JM18_000346 [Phytophthora kernoviae]KAG2532631.1 hypothetical protein JM16_000241 [Phytophthora kernoviae]
MKVVGSRSGTRGSFKPINAHFQPASDLAKTQTHPDAIDLTLEASPPKDRRQKRPRAFYEDSGDETENHKANTALDLIRQSRQRPATTDSKKRARKTIRSSSNVFDLTEKEPNDLLSRANKAVFGNSNFRMNQRQTVLTLKRSITAELRRPTPSVKLLYLTPEKIIKSMEMMDLIETLHRNGMLARFVIDEAHCVSQWGHDFRPEYSQMGILKKTFPDVPVMALTATAPPKVIKGVQRSLHITKGSVFSMSFNRQNLSFEVRDKPRGDKKAMEELYKLISTTFPPDAVGIVYCMTKQESEDVANYLFDRELSADFYHAGQSGTNRHMVQEAWQTGQLSIVCATIAYGMGINKPDVRYVIHFSVAKSIEGYYQEAGRAGRDGKPSQCILFYSPRDISKMRNILNMPTKGMTKKTRAVHMEKLKAMGEYCEDETTCRRQQLISYFGQTFNRSDCNWTCDNCRRTQRAAQMGRR